MSGHRQLHLKCACGSEIETNEHYDFIAASYVRRMVNEWQEEHAKCAPNLQKLEADIVKRLEASVKLGISPRSQD